MIQCSNCGKEITRGQLCTGRAEKAWVENERGIKIKLNHHCEKCKKLHLGVERMRAKPIHP